MVTKIRSVPMEFAVNKFATDITQARLELGLSGEEVAELITVDRSALYKYERGEQSNMKMQNFLSICNIYDLNPANYFVLKA